MLFLIFSRADIRFAKQKFVLRIYTAVKALSITKRIDIIDKKEFAVGELNLDDEIFVVHVVALAELTIMPIYLFY